MFSNSVAGAKAVCMHFGLIQTAKLHDLDPYEYYVILLTNIPHCRTLEDYEKLLPWNIKTKSSEIASSINQHYPELRHFGGTPIPIKIANQNYYIFIQTKPLSNLQIITEQWLEILGTYLTFCIRKCVCVHTYNAPYYNERQYDRSD